MNDKSQQLFEDNINLIHYVMNILNLDKTKYEDFYQIGSIGLLKAVRNYKENLGYAFTTFAVTCIKREILMAVDKDRRSIKCVSLDSNIKTIDGQTSYLEILPDTKFLDLDKKVMIKELYQKIELLPEKEKRDIKRKLQGYTIQEIANLNKESRQSTSSRLKKALKRLRELMIGGELNETRKK